jgi:hypothetical protein
VFALAAMAVCAGTAGAEAKHGNAGARQHGDAYGKKCLAAWDGKRGTEAFRTYFSACVKAGTAATEAGQAGDDLGDEDADRDRAAAACAAQPAFAPPRKTKAARAGYRACRRAAVASQRASARGGRPLTADLSGASEAPGPGDPDAAGTATLTANVGQGRICFDLSLDGVPDLTAAVIGSGAAGIAGASVVDLMPVPAAGTTAQGCVTGLDRGLVKDIVRHPADYYVDVSSSEFPAGAARAQLSR